MLGLAPICPVHFLITNLSAVMTGLAPVIHAGIDIPL